MADERLDRRAFFRRGIRGLLDAVVDTVQAGRAPKAGARPATLRRLRPPGALPEPDFLRLCTRCDDCLAACPAECIVRVPAREPDGGTPVIVPDARACVLCAGLACTTVCRPGALRPLASAAEVAIGLAVVDPRHCLPFRGGACSVCRDACPTEPKAIALDAGKRPTVDATVCTGCGLCEERCPNLPRAIRVEPLAPAAGARTPA